MKLKQFVPVKGVLERLVNVRGLPAAVSLRLARYWRTLGPELEAYEQERVRLVYELGEKDEKGNTIVMPDNMPALNEQIAAMQAQEIELKIKPFDTIDFQNAELTVAEILGLEGAGLLTVDWDNLESEE